MQESHGIIAGDRVKSRAHPISLTECVDISLVDPGIVKRRIVMRGDEPKHGVGHMRQVVVRRKVTARDQADAGLVHAALYELRYQRPCLVVRHKYKKRVRLEITSALQERRKI